MIALRASVVPSIITAFGIALLFGGCASSSTAVCGDGRVQAGEACDDGNTVTETRCAPGITTCVACSADCTAALSLTGPALSVASGDEQVGWVASPLEATLVVKVAAGGAPVEGVGVVWKVEAGGGSVSPETSTTDAAGTAAAVWVLGPAPGPGQVSASASGVAGTPARFVATALERTLELVRSTSGPVADVLPVRVEATGGVAEVALELDGEALGTYATGVELAVDLSGVPEGSHVLVARGVPGGLPARETSLALVVDRGSPRVVERRPLPGAQAAGAGFAVEVVFSEPIVLAGDAALVLGGAGGEVLPGTTASLSVDRRTLRVELPGSFTIRQYVYLRATVKDDADRSGWVYEGPWFARTIGIGFGVPDGWVSTNGPITIAPVASVDAESGSPPEAFLRAGDRVIATLGPPPWAPLVWDTSSAPEGDYPLTIEVPGYVVWSGKASPIVNVDRTPPRITCSASLGGSGGEIKLGECIALHASEWVFGSFSPVLLADGVPQASDATSSTALPREVCPRAPLPSAPFLETLALGATDARDWAGNLAIVEPCEFEVPAWLSPWGSGPVQTPAGRIAAREVAFESLGQGNLAWITRPSAGGAKLLGAKANAPGPFPDPVVIGPIAGDPARVSLSGGRIAWIERDGDGPGRAMLAVGVAGGWTVESEAAGLLNGATDATEVVVPAFREPSSAVVAWCEVDPVGGGQRVRAKTRDSVGWKSVVGDVREDPAAVVSHLSLSDNNPGVTPFAPTLATFLETSPGGKPRVRAATARPQYEATWLPMQGSFNDALAPVASEPSGWAYGRTVIAWVEGGRVLARTAPMEGAFGAAAILNVDPSRAARSPVATGGRNGQPPVVVFIEEGVDGDEIWARAWDGTGWKLVPGPVNAGIPGPVTFLYVSPGPGVAWIDGSGNVRVRLGNF